MRQRFNADELLLEEAERFVYGYDNSRRQATPSLVVLPSSPEQVQQLLALCHQFRIPVVARGSATGTTGAAVPLNGAVLLCTERLNRILRIDPDNRVMVVQPGVTNQQVQQAAAAHGFFWPPDPTSAAVCTIGGNLACNAAGPHALKYGTPRDNVLGLRAVSADGRPLKTGSYTTKGVVGYDLTRLLIGSEGTLAVITEATLKLTPLPEQRTTLRALYADVASAARAVSAIMAQPVTPATLEFMDGQALAMIRKAHPTDLPEEAGALLMIEVDGSAACLSADVAKVAASANTAGCLEVLVADTEEKVAALWALRKALSPTLRTVAPKKINEDVVVPVSQIPALIEGLQRLAAKHAIIIVNFGHAGNGNIHVNLLVNPDDHDELARADACLAELFALVLKLEGTLSGEHGIGLVKRDFVALEIDAVTLKLMQKIKQLFDPHGILNPGKKLPGI
ncbi:MAG: FAD-binding protein [Gammaproteobacteria bacterium]|nr:FAD-binding protein [Gammaproteobacteria bacterium]